MIDRNVDLISPFCQEFSYESLINDFYQIDACSITVQNDILCPDKAAREELKFEEGGSSHISLTNADPVFESIRYKHFNDVGPSLENNLNEIKDLTNNQGK